jgi:hypothetical protein
MRMQATTLLMSAALIVLMMIRLSNDSSYYGIFNGIWKDTIISVMPSDPVYLLVTVSLALLLLVAWGVSISVRLLRRIGNCSGELRWYMAWCVVMVLLVLSIHPFFTRVFVDVIK